MDGAVRAQPRPGVKIPIPRHTDDIPKGTVKAILKNAGLE
ncbi:MAG: type II toxin-antitoxin system HicA family toxin [Spirochaetaceae bacterium]|nr:type II toxin-antitoxin system HicA family toxin [Spirochaetaceae bacterium]